MKVPEGADHAQYRNCAEHPLEDDCSIYSDTSFASADESLVSRRETI